MSRIMALLEAVRDKLASDGDLGLRDVDFQLDIVDLEDVTRQSFKTPAARIVLIRGMPVRNPDRSVDVDCSLLVAVLGRNEGEIPADAATLERAIAVMMAIDNNRWGLTGIGAPRELGLRPALQAGETKGIAVVAVAFQQKLLRVTPGIAAARGPVGEDGAPLPIDEPSIPEELDPAPVAIPPSWGAAP